MKACDYVLKVDVLHPIKPVSLPLPKILFRKEVKLLVLLSLGNKCFTVKCFFSERKRARVLSMILLKCHLIRDTCLHTVPQVRISCAIYYLQIKAYSQSAIFIHILSTPLI
jgi:hypothetical protein